MATCSRAEPVHKHVKDSGDAAIDSKVTPRSISFLQLYCLYPQFILECAQCCFCYLREERQYDYDGETDATMVKFGNPITECHLAVPKSTSKHGVVRTKKDSDLEGISRPIENNHTIQLYGLESTSELPAMGTMLYDVAARVEAISMPALTDPNKIKDCFFMYADAALLELYRRKVKLPSLRGQCCWEDVMTI